MARRECFSTEGKNKGGEESSHLQEQGASPVEGQRLPPGPRGAAQSVVYNRHISCRYFLCLDPLFPFPAIPFFLHLCLHPRGCHSPLPPGSGRGPTGTSQALRWALGPLGRAACLWPKCGVVQLCLPGPHVPAPRAPSCMANTTLPPSPVTSPP